MQAKRVREADLMGACTLLQMQVLRLATVISTEQDDEGLLIGLEAYTKELSTKVRAYVKYERGQ